MYSLGGGRIERVGERGNSQAFGGQGSFWASSHKEGLAAHDGRGSIGDSIIPAAMIFR